VLGEDDRASGWRAEICGKTGIVILNPKEENGSSTRGGGANVVPTDWPSSLPCSLDVATPATFPLDSSFSAEELKSPPLPESTLGRTEGRGLVITLPNVIVLARSFSRSLCIASSRSRSKKDGVDGRGSHAFHEGEADRSWEEDEGGKGAGEEESERSERTLGCARDVLRSAADLERSSL
jgi:hypothetical protein